MSGRRLGERVAVVATAAAVISMVALALVALVGGGGGRGGIAAFNGCIRQTRFLVLVRPGSGTGVMETIKDGARRGWRERSPPGKRPPSSEGPQRQMARMSCPPQLRSVVMPAQEWGAGLASSQSPLGLDHRRRGTASSLIEFRLAEASQS